MFLGLPFTKVMGFDVIVYLADFLDNLDGLDLITETNPEQKEEVFRLLNKSVGEYFPIQVKLRAPLDDVDPLEHDAPCLTIDNVELKEEI